MSILIIPLYRAFKAKNMYIFPILQDTANFIHSGTILKTTAGICKIAFYCGIRNRELNQLYVVQIPYALEGIVCSGYLTMGQHAFLLFT